MSLTSSVRRAECVASLVVRPFTELSGIASTVASFAMSRRYISVCTMFRRIAPGTRRDSAFDVPSETGDLKVRQHTKVPIEAWA